MKELVNQKIGDIGTAKVEAGIQGQDIVAKVTVEAKYPVLAVIDPATKAVDNLLDKLEKAIPGDWDKPMIARFKEDYKKDLVAYLSTLA